MIELKPAIFRNYSNYRLKDWEFKGYTPQGGFAEGLGQFAGSLEDPSTLIPGVGGIKTVGQVALASAASGTVAGGYSMLQDKALQLADDLTRWAASVRKLKKETP